MFVEYCSIKANLRQSDEIVKLKNNLSQGSNPDRSHGTVKTNHKGRVNLHLPRVETILLKVFSWANKQRFCHI